jgi:hypothetical protein
LVVGEKTAVSNDDTHSIPVFRVEMDLVFCSDRLA